MFSVVNVGEPLKEGGLPSCASRDDGKNKTKTGIKTAGTTWRSNTCVGTVHTPAFPSLPRNVVTEHSFRIPVAVSSSVNFTYKLFTHIKVFVERQRLGGLASSRCLSALFLISSSMITKMTQLQTQLLRLKAGTLNFFCVSPHEC